MSRPPIRRLAVAGICAAAFAAVLAVRDRATDAADDPKPAAGGPSFAVEPYLQFATRTSIVVMCETDRPTTCVVEYGTATPPDKAAEVKEPGTLHEVKLDGLAPKTKYFYRVVCTAADGGKVAGPLLTFATAVDPTDAYTFAVIGDTQRNPTVTGKVAKLMWDRRPHFVLHTGDVVDDGPAKWQWTGDLFTPCRELFARVPVYPTIGNHEKNHENYYRYFSLPKPEYHYSFRYGNAEFFAVDTNKTIVPGFGQSAWLDKALAASDARWKVCFHHHPSYSSDSDDYGDTWKGYSKHGDANARALVPVYEKHNVDLVLNGHIHLYERTFPVRGGKVDPKGVVYLTSGGGGGRLEDFDPAPTFFKNQGRVDYHFVYFTVHGGELEGRAFDHDGRLFDQFRLTK
jgi:hypothetical protein